MSKQENRIQWLENEFNKAHTANTEAVWADLRHMLYAASQALLWHDDSLEAKQDREIYRLLGAICFINELATIDAKYKEAA